MLGAKVTRKDNCHLANLDVKNDDCQELLINTNLSYIGLDFFFIYSLWKNLSVKWGSLMFQCFIP